VEVRRLDLRRGLERPSEPQVVLANLVKPLLLELALALPAAPAHIIACGLLAHEVDEVVGAYVQRFRLLERERRLSAQWAAVWLSAPQSSS